tara:strand:- start:2747 stop:3385 length:639 start_codon:yes stop_codon:yes gene_type:complete
MNKIVIIDYGLGNLYSISNAFRSLKIECSITDKVEEIKNCSAIILPGVGSFNAAIKSLESTGLARVIKEAVLKRKVPLLGICLGFQLLFEKSLEHGSNNGLKLLSGVISKIKTKQNKFKIPHTQWNKLIISSDNKKHTPLKEISENEMVYFVHSFALEGKHINSLCTTKYGSYDFTSGVLKDNIFGLQFHPEKSGDVGLKILDNWLKINNLK